ncbi:hypothetical protein ACWCPS_35890 [Streptomyces mauvecolor]
MIQLPPVPGRIRDLPRDERGYPVPAEVPWKQGKPQLAGQDMRRCVTLFLNQCCAICGLPVAEGELLYRLFAQDEADVTVRDNVCRRFDGPGHRDCMIFAGAVCPFFVTANSRRGEGHPVVAKGTPRGRRAALLGFAQVTAAPLPQGRFLFAYQGIRDLVWFRTGDELAARLPADDPAPAGAAPVRLFWRTESEIQRAWQRTQSHIQAGRFGR